MLSGISGGGFALLNCFRITTSLLALALAFTAGCGSSVGQQNDYTCNGYCNGEPMLPLIIQAPDQETACTEFLENCRGSGECTNCD